MCYYHCDLCNYDCVDRRSFDRHIKHKQHILNLNKSKNPNYVEGPKYVCKICNSSYKYASSLTRHKKECEETRINNIQSQLTQIVIKCNRDGSYDIPQRIQDEIIFKWLESKRLAINPELVTTLQTQVPQPAQVRQVNAFGSENYDCVTFGGNFEILRRPGDAFEYTVHIEL